MPTPVAALALVLAALMGVGTSPQTPKPQEKPESSESASDAPATEDTGEIPAPLPPPKPPPDGMLPLAELTRLDFTPRDRPRVLLHGTHLLVVGRSGFVEGHDAASGEFRWKLGLPGEELYHPVVFEAAPLVGGETEAFSVVLSGPSGHVLLVDGLTGDIQQEVRLPFEVALAPIRGPDDILIFASPSGDVVAYDLPQQEVIFETATGETPLALASNDSLIVVSGKLQTLTALDVPAGTLRWTFKGRAGFHAPAAFDKDGARVYVGDDIGELYSLDARNGEVKFRWSTGAAIRNKVLLEGKRLYLASWANTLFAFNSTTGDEHWRTNLPGRPATRPMRVGNRLLVGTYDGVLIEINPARGQPGKQYVAPGEIVFAPSFFLAQPSPDELAAGAEALEHDADRNLEEADPGRELDPDIFGPEELNEAEERESGDDGPAGDQAPTDAAPIPEVPAEPAWFERSRIAMSLRSGEVLLLAHQVAQPPAQEGEEAQELQGEGEDGAPEEPASRRRPPTPESTGGAVRR